MKNIYKLLCLVFLLSCSREEFLDIKPYGVIIPSKTSDYRLLMDYEDDTYNPSSLGTPLSDAYSLQEPMSDDFLITEDLLRFFGQSDVNAYTWQDNIYIADGEDPNWATLYGQIYLCNIVVEEIMDSEGGSISEKKQLEAEARAQRAYAYFLLTNLYGLHYSDNAANNLAIPFRNGTEIEGISFPRASVADLYEFIIEELTASIPNLPDLPDSDIVKFRPSKAGVYGLLARVFLYQGAYDKALENANKSLGLLNSLLDFNTQSTYSFIDVLELPDQARFDPEVLWSKLGSPFNFRAATESLLDYYEDSDLRKKLYAPIRNAYGIPIDAFVYVQPSFANYLQMGITTPEMYLIVAECYARSNNLPQAMSYVNTLRKSRIETANYTDVNAADAAEALDIIKAERRRELAFTGLRFFDLKRYNQFDDANITLSRTLSGEEYTLQANSKNWAIPVAQKYIIQNPEIGENNRE